MVSLAETAVAVSGGRLLAPGWPDRRVQHESTLPLTPITAVNLCAVVCFKDSKGGGPVAVGDDEVKVRAERARAIGLFRYQLIREAADPAHSTKERGKMVRELASREHTDPFGRRVRISRQTIDRWIRDWRAGGFDALVPSPRQCTPRTPAEVLELAVALRRENPERTAAAIAPDPAHPAGLGAG